MSRPYVLGISHFDFTDVALANWLVKRLFVYVSSAALAAGLFVVGARLYAIWHPADTTYGTIREPLPPRKGDRINILPPRGADPPPVAGESPSQSDFAIGSAFGGGPRGKVQAAPSPFLTPTTPSPSLPQPTNTSPFTSQSPIAKSPLGRPPHQVEDGHYIVQLLMRRSEAEAQAAFRTLKAKYSALNGREPLIQRNDLGKKGIFFAAQVGPFSAKNDAEQFCKTLKAAGGSCTVQMN